MKISDGYDFILFSLSIYIAKSNFFKDSQYFCYCESNEINSLMSTLLSLLVIIKLLNFYLIKANKKPVVNIPTNNSNEEHLLLRELIENKIIKNSPKRKNKLSKKFNNFSINNRRKSNHNLDETDCDWNFLSLSLNIENPVENTDLKSISNKLINRLCKNELFKTHFYSNLKMPFNDKFLYDLVKNFKYKNLPKWSIIKKPLNQINEVIIIEKGSIEGFINNDYTTIQLFSWTNYLIDFNNYLNSITLKLAKENTNYLFIKNQIFLSILKDYVLSYFEINIRFLQRIKIMLF